MAEPQKAWWDSGSVAATCPAAWSALLQNEEMEGRFGRLAPFGKAVQERPVIADIVEKLAN
jgi:hypothetical protein